MDSRTNGMAIAGLVLGIVSIVFNFIYALVALIAGVAGIIVSVKAMKSSSGKGMAIAGLVCSIIGLVICLAAIACVCALVGATGVGLASLAAL